MILEAVRMVADALEHETEGVNAQLAALPRDVGDPMPPRIVKVLDPTRNDDVARGESPPDFPVLLVSQIGPATADGEVSPVPGRRDAESVPIGVGYVIRDGSGAEAVRETLYTLRAVVKALRAWLDDTRVDDQLRNGIQVVVCESLTWDETNEDLGEGAVRGFVTAVLSLRDTNA